ASDASDLGDTLAKTLQLCIDKEADDNLTLLAIELGVAPEEARSVTLSPGNFLKTRDKEVLDQYTSFCLRFGFSLEKEMKPKCPPAAALSPVEPVPGPRFSSLPAPAAAEVSRPAPRLSLLAVPGATSAVEEAPSPTGSVTFAADTKSADPGDFQPLVIVGPSGVGKGTLIARLMAAFPGRFGFSVSHTTRKPRPGEVDGESYHFVELESMKKEVEVPGQFIEF
ncbi:unnamed protein product, partial [Polarella glacialis]